MDPNHDIIADGMQYKERFTALPYCREKNPVPLHAAIVDVSWAISLLTKPNGESQTNERFQHWF